MKSAADIESLAAAYERDGVIRIRKFFNASEVADIRAALQRAAYDAGRAAMA